MANGGPGVVVPGCPACKKRLFTIANFMDHLANDVPKGRPGLFYAVHVPVKGVELFRVICREDLEGVVCKHKLAPYSAKPQSWLKILNPDYSQARGRKEMFDRFHGRGEQLRSGRMTDDVGRV